MKRVINYSLRKAMLLQEISTYTDFKFPKSKKMNYLTKITENYVNIHLAKVWTAINRLSII